MRWNMSYEEFENPVAEETIDFTFDTEKEYYDWGEKVALLKYYQDLRKEWT